MGAWLYVLLGDHLNHRDDGGVAGHRPANHVGKDPGHRSIEPEILGVAFGSEQTVGQLLWCPGFALTHRRPLQNPWLGPGPWERAAGSAPPGSCNPPGCL